MNCVLASDISSLRKLGRSQLVLDTGLTYDGGTSVRVCATKREGRFEFSDEGGAVSAAGVDGEQIRFPESIAVGECSANVSRHGVVSLPGFARSSDQWLSKLPALVAECSLALYEALLELEELKQRRRSPDDEPPTLGDPHTDIWVTLPHAGARRRLLRKLRRPVQELVSAGLIEEDGRRYRLSERGRRLLADQALNRAPR